MTMLDFTYSVYIVIRTTSQAYERVICSPSNFGDKASFSHVHFIIS